MDVSLYLARDMKKLLLSAIVVLGITSCTTLKKPTLQLAKSSYQVGAVDVLESVAKRDSALFRELYQEVLNNSQTYNNQLERVFKNK